MKRRRLWGRRSGGNIGFSCWERWYTSHGRGVCVCVCGQWSNSVCKGPCICDLCIFTVVLTNHLGNSLGRWNTNSAKIGSGHSLTAAWCRQKCSRMTLWSKAERITVQARMSESIRLVKVSPEQDAGSVLVLFCGSACSLKSPKWLSLWGSVRVLQLHHEAPSNHSHCHYRGAKNNWSSTSNVFKYILMDS